MHEHIISWHKISHTSDLESIVAQLSNHEELHVAYLVPSAVRKCTTSFGTETASFCIYLSVYAELRHVNKITVVPVDAIKFHIRKGILYIMSSHAQSDT